MVYCTLIFNPHKNNNQVSKVFFFFFFLFFVFPQIEVVSEFINYQTIITWLLPGIHEA